MKKAAIVLLTVLMILSLTACGGGTDGGSSDGGSSDSEASDDPYSEYTGLIKEIPEFHSIDLEGNEVDNSIFAQADITVINIWGTFCPPCVGEMPDLAAWDAELPDNVQIIGIVTDVASADAKEYATARKLVSENGIKYTNIIVGDQFTEGLLEYVIGVPTTLFVDSEGKCVADAVVGAYIDRYKSTVEGLL